MVNIFKKIKKAVKKAGKDLDKAINKVGKELNKGVEKGKNYVNDQFDAQNKQEDRAKACFKSLKKNNIQICNPTNGEVITSIKQTLQKDKSYKYDVTHCLDAFKMLGLVRCNTLVGVKFQIDSENCSKLLANNNIDLCLDGSTMKCTTWDYWEIHVYNSKRIEQIELCKEEFNKRSLVPCDETNFNPSKCIEILKQEGIKLYYQHQDQNRIRLLEISQEKFDASCCKGLKNAPICSAFPFSEEAYHNNYDIEHCYTKLAGLNIYPVEGEIHPEL